MKLGITPRHDLINDRLIYEEKYFRFWKKHGYELIPIPFFKGDLDNFIQDHHIKGIVLAGGYDYYTKEIRDFDKAIIRIALSRKLPIFGVCCGMWSINAYFGGTLKWTENHSPKVMHGLLRILTFRNKGNRHKVACEHILEEGEAWVNSYHRKSIDKLGEGLSPFIRSWDGMIEGICSPENKILAVQFHLENKNCSEWLETEYMELVKGMTK